jgi:hypothetical protein
MLIAKSPFNLLQQISSLIPEAARALGFEAELALAQQAALLTSVLNEIAPHLAKRCRMVLFWRAWWKCSNSLRISFSDLTRWSFQVSASGEKRA